MPSKQDTSAYYTLLALLLIGLLSISTLPMVFYATTAGRSLTEVMVSDGMRASTKYLNYLNFYGTITSSAIAVVCVVGMAQVLITFMFTMVYYSDKAKWDTVDDLKNSGGSSIGNNEGGLQGMVSSVGLDNVIDAFYRCHFNVKRYSACAVDTNSNVNVSDMTGMDYIIQQGPGILFTLLVLNMGWRGTLQMMTSKMIDAFTVGVESLNWDGLVEWAEYKASVETGYTFTLGLSDTEEGKKKEAIARAIFSKVQGVARLTDDAAIQKLGENCENFVVNMEKKFVFTEQYKYLDASKSTNSPLSPTSDTAIINAIWTNLKFNVVLSTTTLPQSVNQAAYANLKDFASPGSYAKLTNFDGYYVVVALRYEENSDQGIFTGSYEEADQKKASVQVNTSKP